MAVLRLRGQDRVPPYGELRSLSYFTTIILIV
jgi:hypothetical protein